MVTIASLITSLSIHRLFRRMSKKTSKLRVTDLCVGNSPGTGEFPAQMASDAENVSIWWRHHEQWYLTSICVPVIKIIAPHKGLIFIKMAFERRYIYRYVVKTVHHQSLLYQQGYDNIPSKSWDEIIHPFPNSNVCTVEVWEWIDTAIPHFLMGVIAYSCCD